jgi:hypothetical protein
VEIPTTTARSPTFRSITLSKGSYLQPDTTGRGVCGRRHGSFRGCIEARRLHGTDLPRSRIGLVEGVAPSTPGDGPRMTTPGRLGIRDAEPAPTERRPPGENPAGSWLEVASLRPRRDLGSRLLTQMLHATQSPRDPRPYLHRISPVTRNRRRSRGIHGVTSPRALAIQPSGRGPLPARSG